jgi:phosphotransferase system enzyme I (PtsI)
LGLKELSVGSKAIPELKKLIRSISYRQAAEVAEKACGAESAEENLEYLGAKVSGILPEVV